MLNKKFLVGMLVIVLVFAITVIGCPKSETSLEGKWLSDDGSILVLDDGIFEISFEDTVYYKGTFYTEEDMLTLTVTHLNGDNFGLEEGLINQEELIEQLADEVAAELEISIEEAAELIADQFVTISYDFELSNDTLTWLMDGFALNNYTRIK